MNSLSQLNPTEALKRLGERLDVVVRHPGATYTVNHPADLEILNTLDVTKLKTFAREHGFNVVRRMGGTIIDFTPVGRSVY